MQVQRQKQIPPLRYGMTNKKAMTSAIAKADPDSPPFDFAQGAE
jgi:hypothetical protein